MFLLLYINLVLCTGCLSRGPEEVHNVLLQNYNRLGLVSSLSGIQRNPKSQALNPKLVGPTC